MILYFMSHSIISFSGMGKIPFSFSQINMTNTIWNLFWFKSKNWFHLTFLCRYSHLIGFLILQNTHVKKFWGETFGSMSLYSFFCSTHEVVISFPTSLMLFSCCPSVRSLNLWCVQDWREDQLKNTSEIWSLTKGKAVYILTFPKTTYS